MKNIKWHKLSEQKPNDSEMEQVILKLGDVYLLLTGQQINKNIIKEAEWSEEEIKKQADMVKLFGFFGQISGMEAGKMDSDIEENFRTKIQQKKLAVETAEWCKFSDVLKNLLKL